jgi:hypothetical protein
MTPAVAAAIDALVDAVLAELELEARCTSAR